MVQILTERKSLITFSLSHVGGIGGNFAGEPQGCGYDPVNDMFYGFSNNSGSRQVKKINRAGTTLTTISNQGTFSNTMQDGCVHNGKVYSIRTPTTASGEVRVYDLDLNFEQAINIPSTVVYGVAIDYAHGHWWITANSNSNVYQVSEDFSTVVATHDIGTGNTYISSPHYSGLAWYNEYMFGVEHTSGGHVDVWRWTGSELVLHQEISTVGLDLYNGIAIDEATNKLYGSSRNLADDLQEYNITIT